MKQTIGLALVLIGVIGCVSLAAREQVAQASEFLASYYSSGPASVMVSTRTGQVLSVLNVPSEIELSVHLIKGEFTLPDDKTGTATFSGGMSIRTRPRSEVVGGRLRERMMEAPLRLDVQDALVVVTKERK